MKIPPALTFTCLFPTQASYLCDGAPVWFLEMLPPFEAGAQAVRISFGNAPPLRQVHHLHGQVLINARVPESELHAAGFNYVRHFAVLPNLRNARWFVPLDNPSLSAGAFRLYTPARMSARLKRFAAQVVAHTRLPVWYRDYVTIASRTMPPIERALERQFPGRPVRVAISTGAPEPARNRKPSLAIMDMRGKTLAIAKMGASSLAARIVRHEADVLATLQSAALGSRVPRLLFSEDVDGRCFTVQSPLAGSPTVAAFTPAHDSFLAALRRSENVCAATTAFARSISAKFDEIGAPANELAEIYQSIHPILVETTIPSTIIHGDFAPWNLRQHHGLISAFDWEYAELDGLPLIDETHFRLQVGYLISEWNVQSAIAALNEMAEAKPLGLAAHQVRALQALYLLDNLARLLGEGYDPHDPMLAWYRELLCSIAPAPRKVAVA